MRPMPALLAAGVQDERLSTLAPFAISLALGALIGIERQRVQPTDPTGVPAGIRTFPLIALLGCASAWLGGELGAPVFAALAASFGALIVGTYVITGLRGDIGFTSEVAAILTFVLGAMVYHGRPLLASALAVATTILLSLRAPLHDLARRLEEADLYAALKLAVVSVIVLPLLPDEPFGPEPYRIFNPFKIWLLVVLIAGIGFAGYVGVKVLGPGRGTAAAGALGGLVSSTAVTLTFAGQSRGTPALSRACALAVALAWATLFGRVAAEIAVVNPSLLRAVAWPLGAALLAAVAGAGLLYLRERRAKPAAEVPHQNPFSLASGLKFAVLFTAILFVQKFAEVRFGDAGVLVAAAVSGTVDVDAITLATARLAGAGEIAEPTAVRAVCLAIASNTVVKAGMAAALGSAALRRALLPIGALTLGAGAVALLASGR